MVQRALSCDVASLHRCYPALNHLSRTLVLHLHSGPGASVGGSEREAGLVAPGPTPTNASHLTSLDVSHTFLDAHGVDAITAALCRLEDASGVLAASPARASPDFARAYDFTIHPRSLLAYVGDAPVAVLGGAACASGRQGHCAVWQCPVVSGSGCWLEIRVASSCPIAGHALRCHRPRPACC